MNEVMEKNNVLPAELKAYMFRKTVWSVTDALVTFVPKGSQPSITVRRILSRAVFHRLIEEENGHTVKCPTMIGAFDESVFRIEKDGWGHENCSLCGCEIHDGEPCWVAGSGAEFFVVCIPCHYKLR